MSPLIKQLVGQAAVYGIADASVKALTFLTIPILSRLMSPAAFGVLELVQSIVTFGLPMAILGFDFSLQTFYLDKTQFAGDLERRRLVSSAFWLLAGWSVVWFTIGSISAPFFADTLFHGSLDADLVRLGLSLTLASVLWWFGRYILRLQFRAPAFAVVTFVATGFTIGLSLGVLIVLSQDIKAYYVTYAAVMSVGGLAALYLIRRELGFYFAWPLVWNAIKIGTPYMPTAVFFVAMTLTDRLLLNRFATLDEVGLYSIALKLVSIIGLVVTMFSLAWSPLAVKSYYDEPQGYGAFYRDVLSYVVALFGLLAVSVTAMAPLLLWMLAPPEYAAASAAVGPLSLAMVALAANQVTTIGPVLKRRPLYGPALVGLAALLNVTLGVLLIPTFGMVGAAWSIATAQMALTTAGGIVTEGLLVPFRYNRRQTLPLALLVLVAVTLGTISKTPSPVLDLVLNGLIVVGYLVGLWALGILNADQLRMAIEWGHRLGRSRLRARP